MSHMVPIPPESTDYHIHCGFDGCAAEDMTLAAIYESAVAAGLREICVVKHYSHELPNKADVWVNWKRTKDEAFEQFLDAFRTTPKPSGLHVLCGVETELLNVDGDINIPAAAQQKIDLALISNHWMPEAPNLPKTWLPLLGKGILPCNLPETELEPWMDTLKELGAEPFAKAVCDGNANALRRNQKARVLAHLDDGFHVLRGFRIPVDNLSDDRLLKLAGPMMDACVETGSLWEITPGLGRRTAIVHEANRRGVRFTGTVDAHFVRNPRWGHTLADHHLVEETIRAFSLTRGKL